MRDVIDRTIENIESLIGQGHWRLSTGAQCRFGVLVKAGSPADDGLGPVILPIR